MLVTSSRAGSRRPPGGWKWTPLGASICRCPGLRRQAAGACAVRPGERAGERLVRAVAGLHGDVDQRRRRRDHPVRRPLEQDPAAERLRRLAGHRADHPVEVEAREVEPAGELVRRRRRGRRAPRRGGRRSRRRCRRRCSWRPILRCARGATPLDRGCRVTAGARIRSSSSRRLSRRTRTSTTSIPPLGLASACSSSGSDSTRQWGVRVAAHRAGEVDAVGRAEERVVPVGVRRRRPARASRRSSRRRR